MDVIYGAYIFILGGNFWRGTKTRLLKQYVECDVYTKRNRRLGGDRSHQLGFTHEGSWTVHQRSQAGTDFFTLLNLMQNALKTSLGSQVLCYFFCITFWTCWHVPMHILIGDLTICWSHDPARSEPSSSCAGPRVATGSRSHRWLSFPAHTGQDTASFVERSV